MVKIVCYEIKTCSSFMNEKQYHVPKKVHLEYLVSGSIFELNFKLASKSLRNSYRSPCTNKRNTHAHIKKQSAHILASSYPLNSLMPHPGHELNLHKTFQKRNGRLLNILCTFNLRLVSMGNDCPLTFQYITYNNVFTR